MFSLTCSLCTCTHCLLVQLHTDNTVDGVVVDGVVAVTGYPQSTPTPPAAEEGVRKVGCHIGVSGREGKVL